MGFRTQDLIQELSQIALNRDVDEKEICERLENIFDITSRKLSEDEEALVAGTLDAIRSSAQSEELKALIKEMLRPIDGPFPVEKENYPDEWDLGIYMNDL